MAAIEQRGDSFRIVFWFQGRRFRRSLETTSKTEAEGTLARLRDNLRRVELGLLTVPDDTDLPTLLLSDGNATRRPAAPTVSTLHDFFENYFDSLPNGSVEPTTTATMRIHQAHWERLLGRNFSIPSLEPVHVQRYIARRGEENGHRGRTLSPVTVKKELQSLKTVWLWSLGMGLVAKPFPDRGLRFPKDSRKPPFQTVAEIEGQIKLGGLTPAEITDLWDCAFLSLGDIAELLDHVRRVAVEPFLYPIFVFAAHTGARRSEIIRCQVNDIHFESGSVLIREKKRVKTVISSRRVPLSPLVSKVLRDWLKKHPGGSHTFCCQPEVVFGKSKASLVRPLTRKEAHNHFKRTLAGTKWEKLRGWHCLRHSFASNCAAAGIDQRIINGWMGHQTEEMVKRYRHLLPDQQQDAIRLVFAGT